MTAKYITVPDGMIRYSLCQNTLIKLAERAEAKAYVGRKILLDSEKIDSYLNNQAKNNRQRVQEDDNETREEVVIDKTILDAYLEAQANK